MKDTHYQTEMGRQSDRRDGVGNSTNSTAFPGFTSMLGQPSTAGSASQTSPTPKHKEKEKEKPVKFQKVYSTPTILSLFSNFRSGCVSIPPRTKDKSVLPWDDRSKTFVYGANSFDTQGKLTTDQIAREVSALAQIDKESWDPLRLYRCVVLLFVLWAIGVVTAAVLVAILVGPNELGLPGIWVIFAVAGIALLFGMLMVACAKQHADKLTYLKMVALVRKLDLVESRYLRNGDIGIRAGKHAAWIEIGNSRDLHDHHKFLSPQDRIESNTSGQLAETGKNNAGGDLKEVVRSLEVMLKENIASNSLNHRSQLDGSQFLPSQPLPIASMGPELQLPILGASPNQLPLLQSNPQYPSQGIPLLFPGTNNNSAAVVEALGVRRPIEDAEQQSIARLYQGLDSSKPAPFGAPTIQMNQMHHGLANDPDLGHHKQATHEDLMRIQMTAQSAGVDPRAMTPKQLAFLEKLSRRTANQSRGQRFIEDQAPLVKYESIKPDAVEMFDPQKSINLLLNANISDISITVNDKPTTTAQNYSSPPSELFRSNTIATRVSAPEPSLWSQKPSLREQERRYQAPSLELDNEADRRFTFSNEAGLTNKPRFA